MTQTEASALTGSLFLGWYCCLVRYAARLTGSRDVAEDLVQEVFLRLYRELRHDKTIRDPKSWTFCVLRNEISKRIRVQIRENAFQTSVDSLEQFPAEPFPRDESGHDADELTRLLTVLTPREEEVVLLRMASMKYREIADRLGIAVSSVNTLLARALRKLQAVAKPAAAPSPVPARMAKHVAKTLQ